MGQPDLDQTLAKLRQALSNTLTMINICVQLQHSERQLLPLLGSMMRDLCEQIEQALPTLPDKEGETDA